MSPVLAVQPKFAEIQNLAAALQAAGELSVPTRLNASAPLTDAALTQVLLTWSRGNQVHAELNTSSPDKALSRLATTSSGLALLLLAQLRSRKGGQDLTTAARHVAIREMRARRTLARAARGQRIVLPNLDFHQGTLSPLLYNFSGPIPTPHEGRGYYDVLIDRSLRHLLGRSTYPVLQRPAVTAATTAVHELFRNTHHWARTDHLNRRIPRSLRFLSLGVHEVSDWESDQMLQGLPEEISSYIAGLPKGPARRMLEVSVVDSGPGLPGRLLGSRWHEDVPPELELVALTDCFAKHRTTSQKSHRGVGLYRVLLDTSHAAGFIYLRCGHFSLYRNMVERPFEVDEKLDLPSFSHLYDEDEIQRFPRRPLAVGSAFSILLPV